LAEIDPEKADLLVILGGPIGAFDEMAYPFLSDELALIGQRLAARRPTLGICLGAQLMARVLGADVRPMEHKEIGFGLLQLSESGYSSVLSAMAADTEVLHWHGDMFGIPVGATSLAISASCPHQAFAVDRYALGLQFHLEADLRTIERWLVGHAVELSASGVAAALLRAQARESGAKLHSASAAVFGRWLDELECLQ
jgi:GMP synthase (glutamine-hydrolysing)